MRRSLEITPIFYTNRYWLCTPNFAFPRTWLSFVRGRTLHSFVMAGVRFSLVGSVQPTRETAVAEARKIAASMMAQDGILMPHKEQY